jgi:BirA family transcriptional regulator, biotin operon repressor / biotin---[acetyl-CoA-carboxylase] ligase
MRHQGLPRHDARAQELTQPPAHTMPEPTLAWQADELQSQLAAEWPGLVVEVVAEAGSTNSVLLDRTRAPLASETGVQVRRSVESAAFGSRETAPAACLLVAEHQSAGRGRQGRHWQAAPGASLTFSLGLPLAAADWSGLSLAVGVALCEALAGGSPADPQLALKWPNDLWLLDEPVDRLGAGRKLGGILIETVAAGAQRHVVIGIGLNVAPFGAVDAHTGFASLHELHPALTAPQALARVALPLLRALRQFERDGFAAFAERFAALDLLCGRSVSTTLTGVPEGVACGVSATGALRVRTGSGPGANIIDVSSGEVSVRLAAAA